MKVLKCVALVALSLVLACGPAAGEEVAEVTKNPEALAAYQRGQQAGRQGEHADALRQFQAAVRHDPKFAEGHMQAGHVLVWLGRAEEGIAHYEEAIRVSSRPAVAWLSLAKALGQVGRHEAGLEAFRRAAELDPGLAQGHSQVAHSLQRWLDDFLPVRDPAAPYELDGFAVTAPAGEHWWVERKTTRTEVRFDRNTGRGRDHTVIAWAESFRWPHAKEALEEAVRKDLEAYRRGLQDPARYSDLRFEVTTRRVQGMSCIQASFAVRDRGVPYAPGEAFTMRGWDIYCPNFAPSTPMVLKLALSQRYAPRFQPLSLETDLERFVEGARVRAVPQ